VAVDLGYLLLIAFASTRLTELWKEIMIRIGILRQQAWWKAGINLVICALGALLILHRPWETRILIAAGASGLAMLLHAGDTSLRHYRDKIVAEVLGRTRGRQR
jgi:hypothetical protein